MRTHSKSSKLLAPALLLALAPALMAPGVPVCPTCLGQWGAKTHCTFTATADGEATLVVKSVDGAAEYTVNYDFVD